MLGFIIRKTFFALLVLLADVQETGSYKSALTMAKGIAGGAGFFLSVGAGGLLGCGHSQPLMLIECFDLFFTCAPEMAIAMGQWQVQGPFDHSLRRILSLEAW